MARAGHAVELMFSGIEKADSRTNEEIFDGRGHQQLWDLGHRHQGSETTEYQLVARSHCQIARWIPELHRTPIWRRILPLQSWCSTRSAPNSPERGESGLRTNPGNLVRLVLIARNTSIGRSTIRSVPAVLPLASIGEAVPFSILTEAPASGREWVVGLASACSLQGQNPPILLEE